MQESVDKRSVCLIVYNKYPADTRVKRAAESLQEHGYHVHVICTAEENRPLRECVNGVEVYRVGTVKKSGARIDNLVAIGAFFVQVFIKVRWIAKHVRPYIYHVHSLPDFLIYTALLPKLGGAKLVLDLHESFPEIVLARFTRFRRVLSRVAAWLEKASCAIADHVIVVNDTIRHLVNERGEQLERITVIMNSPKPPRVGVAGDDVPVHESVQAAKASATCTFVYAGGLNRERDIKCLVDAVKHLRNNDFALEVVLFTHTETPFLTEMLAYIRSTGLERAVRYCGSLEPESVMTNLRQSDIGIVSYERNPLTEIAIPNKVFEYIEAKVPLVCAALPTLRDLLQDDAEYYEPGDAQSLAASIRSAYDQRDNQARKRRLSAIYEKCKWPVMEGRLLDIYAALK